MYDMSSYGSATSQAERVNNREMPDINVQYLIAVMLIDKTVSFPLRRTTHSTHEDPAILREHAKVELVGDEELERLLPTRVENRRGEVELTGWDSISPSVWSMRAELLRIR